MLQDLKAIRVFLTVAEHLSFAQAAKALDLTPATVTRIIARLEEDLGHQLLLRTTRQVSLTSQGARIAGRYAPVIAEFDRVAAELSDAANPLRGRLSVNVPMSFGMRLMPALIESFRLAYPTVDLVIHLSDALTDILTETCDLAVRISMPPKDQSSIWRKVCVIPRTMVAAPSFLEAHGPIPAPEALPRALCLSYGHGQQAETWRLSRGAETRLFKAGESIISNNGEVLYALACRGQGITVLPDFLVAKGLRSGAVVAVLPDWEVTPLWLSLSYPPYARLPPLVSAFTDFFEAFLKDFDGFDFTVDNA
ncbi:LysR family transcriptional regulator [Pseudaestuariivita rosea]|uniref:LysR family transcriptional regulator n=1 Tax=Pseudaestuariivita rosea TaxID=2763263 RepID=UPI001ABB8F64|nr:LysR family transcriptional regulator [Pseudaestuariivita rosea]